MLKYWNILNQLRGSTREELAEKYMVFERKDTLAKARKVPVTLTMHPATTDPSKKCPRSQKTRAAIDLYVLDTEIAGKVIDMVIIDRHQS